MSRRHKTAHRMPEQADAYALLAAMFSWVAPDELASLARADQAAPQAEPPTTLATPGPRYLAVPALRQRRRERTDFSPEGWRTFAFQIRLRSNAAMSLQTLRDTLEQDKDFQLEQQEGAMVWGYVDYRPADRASLRGLARVQRMLRRWQVRGYVEYQLRRIPGT